MEIRRAAILAAAMNEDKSFIPDILGLLNDPSPTVCGPAAPVALQILAGKGPDIPANASTPEREQARVRWEEWWRQNKAK